MNRKEWKELSKVDRAKAHYWYNKVKKKRLSKEFELLENCDKDANVIHHLIDTEEQRKYNDEHYEMFGLEIDENGNEVFNYGKYIVFWTKEHHDEYHRGSEETRKKRIASLRKVYENPEMRERCSKSHKGIKCKEETKLKISAANKGKQYFGDKNPFYGKHHTEESCKKMSEAHKGKQSSFKGKHHSSETCKKISEANKGKQSSFKGKHHSSESIKTNRDKNIASRNEVRQKYIAYKNNGGALKWNEFQKMIKDGELIPFEYDFKTKEFKPAIEEIQINESVTDESQINPYEIALEEDNYDYMQ